MQRFREKGWSPFSDEYFRVSAESSDEGETETDGRETELQKWKDPISRRQYIF